MSGEEGVLEMAAGTAGSQHTRATGLCGSTGGGHAGRQQSQDETEEERRKSSRRSESRSAPPLSPGVNGQRQWGLIRNQQGFPGCEPRGNQIPGCPSLGPPSGLLPLSVLCTNYCRTILTMDVLDCFQG